MPATRDGERTDVKLLPLLPMLALSFVSAPVAFAQSGVAQCVSIAAEADRLACYDGLFRTDGSTAQAISVTLESEQLIPARPSGRKPAQLTVTCDAGVLSVAFSFAGNTMSALGRDAGLTLQSDLQAARSRTLPVNADNTALVIDSTVETVAFLQSLEGATNLTARVTPVNSRSLSVRFRVDTFADEVAPVRGACGA